MTKIPAGPAVPQLAVYKSLGLNALLQQLEGMSGYSILDLGAACGTNVEFWSQFGCKIFVEDLYHSALPYLGRAAEEEEPPQLPLPEILEFSPETRFDVILAWDLFNYLEAPHIEAVVHYLAQFCHPGTYAVAIMSVQQQRPAEPNRYKIVDTEHVAYEPRSAVMRTSPRYQPRDINRLMAGFRVSSSFLLRHGVQEYVFIQEGASPAAGAD